MRGRMRNLLISIGLVLSGALPAQAQRWREEVANDWYQKQPWLVGSNYTPATAVNEL